MLLLELTHGEGEVSVGEGLVAQREVPPLTVERLETVVEHGPAQDHAVLELLFGDAAAYRALTVVARVLARLGIAAEVRMTLRTKPVEGAAHVELLLGGHVEESQVDGGATGLSSLLLQQVNTAAPQTTRRAIVEIQRNFLFIIS